MMMIHDFEERKKSLRGLSARNETGEEIRCFGCGLDLEGKVFDYQSQSFCRACWLEIPTVLRLEPVKQVAR